MASRYFFALWALAVIAAVAAAPAEEEVQLDDEVELDGDKQRIWPALAAMAAEEAARYIAKNYIKVKVKCIPDIVKNCSGINPVLHPKTYYKCGDKYAKANADRYLKKD